METSSSSAPNPGTTTDLYQCRRSFLVLQLLFRGENSRITETRITAMIWKGQWGLRSSWANMFFSGNRVIHKSFIGEWLLLICKTHFGNPVFNKHYSCGHHPAVFQYLNIGGVLCEVVWIYFTDCADCMIFTVGCFIRWFSQNAQFVRRAHILRNTVKNHKF